MTIISVGNFGKGWDNSICDEVHIADALEQLGHIVFRFQREDTREAYWKLPKADFVLIQQWDGYGKDLIERLRMFSNRIVTWSFDFQEWGQEWHERLVKQSDLYLSKRIADSKYPNWQYLSQDFAPDFLGHTIKQVARDIDVLFTGSYLPWATERNEIIKTVNEKFSLVVHSVNDWPFLQRKPPIMDEGLPELYARAKVILSIDHTLEIGYHSDRNAQIMFCYERPLFRYIPMSELVFKDKVDYFYDMDDCLARITERLANPVSRYTQEDMAYIWEAFSVKSRVKDLLTIVKSIL